MPVTVNTMSIVEKGRGWVGAKRRPCRIFDSIYLYAISTCNIGTHVLVVSVEMRLQDLRKPSLQFAYFHFYIG